MFNAIKWSPASHTFKTDTIDAACPDDVQSAPVPPSSIATFFSKASTVGLLMREYICPGTSKSNSLATFSVVAYL